jgi:exopolysaccharide biosynthesis WecB/TagA/CpsF family protein
MTIPYKRPPTIFCIGYYGHSNLGDEVSLGVLKSWMNEIAPHHEVITSLSPRTIKKLLLNYLYLFRAELIVFGNGNLFQSLTSKKSFYFYLSLLFVARICCKPLIALSQGIGPLTQYEQFFLNIIAGRMVWCSRDGTHPRFVRLIKSADLCEGSLNLFQYSSSKEKLSLFQSGHLALLNNKQHTSFISTDRLHIVIAAHQCDIPVQFPDNNSKIINYTEWTKNLCIQKRIQLKNRNKRILKWALRWQGVVKVPQCGLLYSFNPIVISNLRSNPFKIKQGLIDGLGVKILPRFWGTTRLRGVDITQCILTHNKESKILVWGMNPTTYQSYGCPWKHISGYDDEISIKNAITEILEYNPTIVFICQQSPEQEIRGQLLSLYLPHALIILVGGSFDALYGDKKLFPTPIHTLGIEWLLTVFYHPTRISRLPSVVSGIIKGFIKLR